MEFSRQVTVVSEDNSMEPTTTTAGTETDATNGKLMETETTCSPQWGATARSSNKQTKKHTNVVHIRVDKTVVTATGVSSATGSPPVMAAVLLSMDASNTFAPDTSLEVPSDATIMVST